MKRKVKKYAGGNLVDSSGNPVRSSSSEPVRTRYGKDDEDRPKSSGVEDYASLGKRASATSPFSGPKEYISESIKEDVEVPSKARSETSDEESVAGKGARNLALEEPEIKVKKKTVVKKKSPSYEDTGAKIGSQGDFKMKPSMPVSTSGMGPKNTFLTKERMGVKDTSTGSFMDRIKEHLGNEFKSKNMASGGKVSSASSRGDGIAQRGKTKGRIC